MDDLKDEQADSIYTYDWYINRYGINSPQAVDFLEVHREPEIRALLELWCDKKREALRTQRIFKALYGSVVVLPYVMNVIMGIVTGADFFSQTVFSVVLAVVIWQVVPSYKEAVNGEKA